MPLLLEGVGATFTGVGLIASFAVEGCDFTGDGFNDCLSLEGNTTMISMGASAFLTDFTGEGFLDACFAGETFFSTVSTFSTFSTTGFSTFTGLGFFIGVCLAGVFLTDFFADLVSVF